MRVRDMIKDELMRLLFVAAVVSLSGCAVTPDNMPTYRFDSGVVSNSPSNSVITSVASVETLQKLKLPIATFIGSENFVPPDSLDGRPTIKFAKMFAGIPVDGNFQVEVSPGIKKLGIHYYYNRPEIKEYIVQFSAEPGHSYYTKFLIDTAKQHPKKHMVTPIIYDLTSDRPIESKFVSDEAVGVTVR